MFVLKDLTLTDESDLDKTIQVQVQNEEVIRNHGHIKFLEPWNYVYIYKFFLKFLHKSFMI